MYVLTLLFATPIIIANNIVEKTNTKNPISDLYNSKFLSHSKASLSHDKLLLLKNFCRFDDANARDDTFNNCCRELYGLGPHPNFDKMLQKFRGHCRSRQYMPSKQGSYGVKYWILADAENHYCYNAISYLGKEGDAPAGNLGAHVVRNLVETIKGTNHNVTYD